MKNGYYLSTFMNIDELCHLLEVRLRHDQNIALWRMTDNNIELVHYWELERVTGLKQHSTTFFNVEAAKSFINELLSQYNITLDDIVEVWGTPQLDSCTDYHSIDKYPSIAYHSIAHLFSAVMFDSEKFFNGNIIGLAVDAAPENVVELDAFNKYYYAGCIVKNGEMEIMPVYSPGRLWSYPKRIFNLREGSLMALAEASKCEAYLVEDDILALEDINSYALVKEYVDNLVKRIWAITEADEGKLFNGFDPNFNMEENRISMVMKIIQKLSYKTMERNIDMIIRKYNINTEDTYLAVAGGFALNCPTNSYLMDKYKFKGFIAPPCVNDCGISLGIGLYAFYKKMNGEKININIDHAYYGDKDDSLNEILDKKTYELYIKSISDLDYNVIVEDIKEAPIVWFNGRSEIGPRALGNRSIIADPRKKETKDVLNVIKQREWWRPVAPIVIQEDAKDYFENCDSSAFMLRTFVIKEDKIDIIPAVAHLNDTGRIQTVSKNHNEELYNILKAFREAEGISVLCNTSLNDKGEPIINKIEEALNFTLRKNIKVIYINGKRLELHNHEAYSMDKPLKRNLKYINSISNNEKEELLQKYNPNKITKEALTVYYDNHELMNSLDLNNKDDVRKLSIHTKVLFSRFGSEAFKRD